MLEEAKRKYLQMRKDFMDGQRSRYSSFVDSFNAMLQEVEAIAIRHTRKYFDSRMQQDIAIDDFEFVKVKEMYKIIIVPDNSLRNYFSCLQQEEAKKAFRMYALHIHPDKNSHPSAKIAFQKLFKAFIVDSPRVGGGHK